MAKLMRSKKFQGLSDADILKRYKTKPEAEALHFLIVEIDERGLREQADSQAKQGNKKSRHSIFYYLLYRWQLCFLGVSVRVYSRDASL
jgi:hypothetical protein